MILICLQGLLFWKVPLFFFFLNLYNLTHVSVNNLLLNTSKTKGGHCRLPDQSGPQPSSHQWGCGGDRPRSDSWEFTLRRSWLGLSTEGTQEERTGSEDAGDLVPFHHWEFTLMRYLGLVSWELGCRQGGPAEGHKHNPENRWLPSALHGGDRRLPSSKTDPIQRITCVICCHLARATGQWKPAHTSRLTKQSEH